MALLVRGLARIERDRNRIVAGWVDAIGWMAVTCKTGMWS